MPTRADVRPAHTIRRLMARGVAMVLGVLLGQSALAGTERVGVGVEFVETSSISALDLSTELSVGSGDSAPGAGVKITMAASNATPVDLVIDYLVDENGQIGEFMCSYDGAASTPCELEGLTIVTQGGGSIFVIASINEPGTTETLARYSFDVTITHQ